MMPLVLLPPLLEVCCEGTLAQRYGATPYLQQCLCAALHPHSSVHSSNLTSP